MVRREVAGDVHGFTNFFASVTGRRKGPKVAAPRFRSRKDNRHTIRLTRNGFSIRPNGRLYVAKVGEIPVRWSRSLPSAPSSVTVVKDAAGRYFASFVVQTGPSEFLPETTPEIGIDLGLTHFAVLSDGRKASSPKFLRRAERKPMKAVARVARLHARVADTRRDHHHKLSTQIIRENQAVYVEDHACGGTVSPPV
ncbi:RNA-guided endonuclease InsQ/TnpB family protein [Streptomyces sp. NPDC001536]|uniref:RNA-guided endonuclease InsQ/TnpB family protein n=1 Tax=Streptomyces sp. NPDC001536 TaxID=3364583 RepID=UPI003673F903